MNVMSWVDGLLDLVTMHCGCREVRGIVEIEAAFDTCATD